MRSSDIDVVVVGYGYAGAAAALSAASSGARVLLLEKAATPGGISICSGGGVRAATDEDNAFAYLKATCAGKTPDPILRRLAEGMVRMRETLTGFARVNGAVVAQRVYPGNYPLPGTGSLGSMFIESIPNFDPAVSYPHVRGSAENGALLFKVMEDNVSANTDKIEVVTNCAARRLRRTDSGALQLELAGGTTVAPRGGIILACGGFEADAELQAQYWPGGPALPCGYRHNTGDGLRMAQALGAGLWHMWHYHGSYGYRLPDPSYPYGIRVKSLPNWWSIDNPHIPKMVWILLDCYGRRFMNEYEPYGQDTGHRPLAHFDPATQSYPRKPSYLVTNEAGRLLYPLGRPIRNDPEVSYEWSRDNSREIASGLFRKAATVEELASLIDADPQVVANSIDRWNSACANGLDPEFGRPPNSMHPLREPPFYVAEVHQIVSNTQGGPLRDEEQRVLDAFGDPIPGLYVAGECSSAFGHLYLGSGNVTECFVSGEIAGRNAARFRWEDKVEQVGSAFSRLRARERSRATW
ncbi:FAD-dependent oxidoreductase [Chelativorans xinjiangense]|uniref:FAD-dependent oxidoreductase n=1 Tax=Chelativorans xinjiangense TaxID=2681485 RepID=UPI001FE4850A|nr:FAD-dependent oxidoreductase [Chelativorans xinjiangense]